MAGDRLAIGSDGGLAVTLDEVLTALEARVGRPLSDEEAALAAPHLDRILRLAVTADAGPIGLERRVGEGRYLAVGDLGSLGLSVLLGPIAHLIAAGAALRSARRLIKFDEGWRPRVVAVYARLEGTERDVFETVHDRQNEWIVANYDALAEGNYGRAFGRTAPTAKAITEALATSSTAEDVSMALEQLVGRGILQLERGRYRIRF